MKNQYDIVVIGSGVGGLASAALIAELGKKVLIIEKEPKPGGYLTEFRNEDFVFDVSLHLLNGCSSGGHVHDILKKCHVIDNIKFLKPKYLYRSVFPDFDIRVPQMDMESYKGILGSRFPGSENGINSLFGEMSDIYNSVNDYVSQRKVSRSLLSSGNIDAKSLLDKHIKNEQLKAVLSQMWIYFGLPLSQLRAVDFCYPWVDYTKNGGYYIEKGSYELVKALVAYIKGMGGEFLFNKNVGRIALENGSHRKVFFGKDEVICDTIISNVDITKTVFEIIGSKQFPLNTLEKLKDIEPSISAFEVFLGLDIDMKRICPDEYEIFVSSDYDVEKQYTNSLSNNAKIAPFVITINSNVNRFSAPSGKSVVTLIMLAGYNYWVSRSREEYQDKKEKIANILIERASKIIPEIKTHIQKKVISTPVTFQRYTNNSGGAIYGYSGKAKRGAEIRPNEIDGINNLYFASAWAKQGSGVAKVLRSAEDVYAKISKRMGEGVLL